MSHEPSGAASGAGGGGGRGDHGGYERSDARAWATIRAGLYILAVMFAVAAALIPLYRWLARSESAEQPRAATVLRERPAPGVFPKLVTSEPLALAEFRAQEDGILNGYAWAEKDRGIARIPIAEAMKRIGERGRLPVFPAPSGAANDAGAAPSAGARRAARTPTTPGGGR